MKEHPIIFNGENVRAILNNRKTQTRRVIKPQPSECWDSLVWLSGIEKWRAHHPNGSPVPSPASPEWRCPYGAPGDRLWVRETWGMLNDLPDSRDVVYRADYPGEPSPEARGWRPSIHMYRWASRITLEVVDVQVERMQDITPSDCIAEGIEIIANEWSTPWYRGLRNEWKSSREAFANLWDSINAKRGYPWADNPWVWAVTFKMMEL